MTLAYVKFTGYIKRYIYPRHLFTQEYDYINGVTNEPQSDEINN